MIQAEVSHCTTLEEFYKEIRSQQEASHGVDYCEQHDALHNLLNPGDIYRELGTNQGGTAAAACLSLPSKIELVDISFNKFMPNINLFNTFCTTHKIELILKEISSTNRSSATTKCDILLVDSFHKGFHLIKELKLHSPTVSKYMIFHDTSKPTEELYEVLKSFCTNSAWTIHYRSTNNVGYTILKRK